MSNKSSKSITFCCHFKTYGLKKLCSLICKRSLPRFSKMHPHRCLGSCSARWLCHSRSLWVSIYMSFLKRVEKDTTGIASSPIQWPVCVKHQHSGNKVIRLTKLGLNPEFKCYIQYQAMNRPQLPVLENRSWKSVEIGYGSHNPSVTRFSHPRSQVVSFSKIHKAHVYSLWEAPVLSGSLLKFRSERMPSSQKPQHSRMIPSATGWASFSAKYIIYNLSNCEKVRVEFF